MKKIVITLLLVMALASCTPRGTITAIPSEEYTDYRYNIGPAGVSQIRLDILIKDLYVDNILVDYPDALLESIFVYTSGSNITLRYYY